MTPETPLSGDARRRELRRILSEEASDAGHALSASALAARLSVSRQVIVGDIALLRSSGFAVDATPRGYVRRQAENGLLRQLVCCHDGAAMTDELNTIVDFGCTVCDVIVDHPIYGKLTGELKLSSRYDVSVFAERVRASDALPLSALTEGVHIHTISCPSEEVFERVRKALAEKGYLMEKE